MKSIAPRAIVGLAAALTLPTAASAQAWTPASEVVGQPIQVTTNGVTDTVTLNPGGQVQIVRPVERSFPVRGLRPMVSFASAPAAAECFPYSAPFQAGQPVTVTSSCNATSTWLAASDQSAAGSGAGRGERGR